MGAYLSEPVTKKHSSEDASDTLVVGASSMQGWRVNQEDAHNTVLDFDKGIQLFAVYDGHGGSEVAIYCSQKLPDFIRQCEAYSKGDLEEALKQAFLDLDSSLTKEEVIAELRKIAFRDESDAEEEGENVANLREEASMPLEDVMAKYQSSAKNPLRKLQSSDGKLPLSPCVRRGTKGSGSSTEESGPSSSGAGSSSSGQAASSSCAGSSSDAENAITDGSSSTTEAAGASSNSAVSSSVPTDGEKLSEPVSASSKPVKEETEEKKSKEAESIPTETTLNGPSEEKNSKPQINGDVPHTNEELAENADAVSSTTENSALNNGKVHETEEVKPSPKGKGKAKDKTKSISKDEDGQEEKKAGRTRTTPIRKLSSLHLMQFLASQENYSDSEESEDEEDTSFEGKLESSDDEDVEEGEEEDDDEDDDDEDDYEDTDSEDEGENSTKLNDELYDECGRDSGCTAVVALLRGRDLFVANAGDSRCVVCRDGKAIDMSLDHKPEDPPEMSRILAAGGKVTCDGRVNGGLNLSRAIGDHAYKKAKNIPATKQMITALPDVRTLRIDPKQDEFMILACDGIWNFMSSQDVVDFVRERLVHRKLTPAKICEELFDHCISPDTMGDGTGCDNMTAVIVHFQAALEKEPSTLERETILESPITNDTSKKGDVEDVEMGKDKDEEEDKDETKENIGEEEAASTDEASGAKKRVSESSDSEEVLSPKQKKVKVEHEASEANGVQV